MGESALGEGREHFQKEGKGPAFRKPGNLEAWRPGNPEALESWNPRKPGTPEARCFRHPGILEALEPQRFGAPEPRSPGTPESWNLGILESWNLGILESWNLGVPEPWNPEIPAPRPGTLEILEVPAPRYPQLSHVPDAPKAMKSNRIFKKE